MNAQERELLTTFLQQMAQASAGQKDAEAEALIRAASARQPDAAYLLVQRAMQLEYALQAAQAKADQLQAELDQVRPGSRSGFLNNPNAWGRGAADSVAGADRLAPTSIPGKAGGAERLAPTSVPSKAAGGAAPAWGSGMLGAVAGTAAGVVAGSFLFQGIQGLMGDHDKAATAPPPASANATPPSAESAAADAPYETVAAEDTTDLADGGGWDSGDLA